MQANTVCLLAFNRVGISDLSLLDEVGEEECGVADDASSARLLMLTALQDEPIIHVTLRMEAGLVQDREHIHLNKNTLTRLIFQGDTLVW